MRRTTPLILVVALAACLGGSCAGEDDKTADELQDVDLSGDDLPEELESPIAAAASRATDECDLDEPTG